MVDKFNPRARRGRQAVRAVQGTKQAIIGACDDIESHDVPDELHDAVPTTVVQLHKRVGHGHVPTTLGFEATWTQ